MRLVRTKVALLLLGIALLGCSSGQATTGPQPGKLVGGVPQGMFFMTRYWSFTGTLEKAAWYFAPDGKVYQNLTGGFSPEDLAAHDGRQGTYRLAGNKLEVNWKEGESTASEIEVDGAGFMWDMGIFTPALPFASTSEAAGKYEGGERISVGGDTAAVAKTLTLDADGSFHWEGIGLVEGTGAKSIVTAASESGTQGTWQLDGYTITLATSDGKKIRYIGFPVDDTDTPIKPDRMFFGGMLYKRME